MKSIGEVLDDSNGIGSGFDFLRITLSLSVVALHAYQISLFANGGEYKLGPGLDWTAINGILIMFFGLSGFLIAASAIRLNLKNFLINRGLRIFPALAVEIILSALVLGPLFTTLPLSEYFTNYKFYLYFGNLLGFVYMLLPGVFNGAWVNGSLWTVPYEMGCYFVISLLIYFKCLHQRWIIVAFTLLLLVIQIALALWGYNGQPEITHNAKDFIRLLPANWIDYLFHREGSKLLVSFTTGIAVYLFRYQIPYSKALLALIVVYLIAVEAIGQWHDSINPTSNVFVVAPFLYITIFLGVSKIPTLPIMRRGDYSYGIYLYGFPFTQAAHEIFPEYSKNWVFLLLACLVPTLLFAAASWHLIERPVLQLRKKFSFVARQRLAGSASCSSPILEESAC